MGPRWHFATIWAPPYVMLVRSAAPYLTLPAGERRRLREGALSTALRRTGEESDLDWSTEQTAIERQARTARVMRTD